MATIRIIEYRKADKNGEVRTIKKHKATVTIKGFPRISRTFDRKTDASEWASKTEYEYKHQRSFGHDHHRTKTLTNTIERYSQYVLLTNPKWHQDIEPILKWWDERLGKTRLGDLSKDLILQQRDRLMNTHVRNNPKLSKLSNARVNRVMAILNRALNLATDEWGWLAKNPIIGIEKLPEPTGRTRFLQGNEREDLLAAARCSDNADMYAIIILALTTGARRGEIERIRIKDVDFEQKKILLPITKNKKPRILHLVEPAYSHIKQIHDRPRPEHQDYLFASPHDVSRPNSFRRAWRTTIKRAKLEDFRFHDLRHSAASFLAQHGAGLHQISEILGHSSYQVTKRYLHLVDKNIAAIVESTAAKVFGNEKVI